MAAAAGTSATPTFIDTNVLVYAVDTADRLKQAAAQRAIEEATLRCVSPQVLSEYYVTVTRKLARPLDEETAAADVADLAAGDVVPTDGGLVLAAVRSARRWQLSLWDAMIVESARRGGCSTVLSEDLDDATDFDGIRVVNPFGRR